jgi:hypothetical protein
MGRDGSVRLVEIRIDRRITRERRDSLSIGEVVGVLGADDAD